MSPPLVVNDVIESVMGEDPFSKPARVLWIDRNSGDVTLITIESPPKRPWLFGYDELALMLQAGLMRKTKVRIPAFMLDLEEDLPENAKKVREKKLGTYSTSGENSIPRRDFLSWDVGYNGCGSCS